jgi:hypothetical protein
MTALRRHVRLWVIAWLFAQAASLSAFVPRDCCASHRPTAATPACHEAPKATHCVLRGTCEGPPLFTVFSHAGILPDTSVAAACAEAATLTPDLREAPVTRTRPPTPRPPRN